MALGQPETGTVKLDDPKVILAWPQTTGQSAPYLLHNLHSLQNLPLRQGVYPQMYFLPPHLCVGAPLSVFFLHHSTSGNLRKDRLTADAPQALLSASSLSSVEKAFATTKCELKNH